MIAEELINPMVPPLKLSDTAEKAMLWMEELKINQLPVVEGRHFLGLITEDAILECNHLDRPVSEFRLIGENCYIHDHQHLFDIIRVSREHDSELVAILNDAEEFLGVSSYQETLKAFGNTLTVQNEGGILVITIQYMDYSMAEIARIVESNGVKIYGSYVSPHQTDPQRLLLTLKLSKEDLSAPIASLERFGYQIVAKFHSARFADTDKERLDNLLKYLNL
jgi:acetoin utilization protein AcuB